MGFKMLLLLPALVMYNRAISMLGSSCLLFSQNLDICESKKLLLLVFKCNYFSFFDGFLFTGCCKGRSGLSPWGYFSVWPEGWHSVTWS